VSVLNVAVLDNPVWHALNTEHARFAIGTSLAKRYQSDVSPFCAVIDFRDEAIRDLSQFDSVRLLSRDIPSELPGWTLSRTFTIHQMVCEQPVIELKVDVPMVDLSEADVPDMLRLIELTRPGPFAPRTIELGHYVGIRHGHELVAIAGERLSPTGYHEISAICTAPGHQGKGYARILTSHLINENLQHGIVPFLHVVPTNAPAYHLYESLNFRKRAEVQVAAFNRHG
jgi:predicted GNAT family acetyltransferase